MNHIYRSLWNEKLGTYVAVAETAVSRGKKVSSSQGGAQHFAVTALVASLCLGWGGAAMADPTGGVVTAGSASISQTAGNTTIVQGSQNAAINWQSFGIGAGQSVQFVQPNAASVALNRVVGGDPSAILGKLSANGKVFLVNPNGIMFGPGASVNVGGLVASTLNISDVDFMAGRYKFSGTSTAGVVNQGSINAPGGYVALLGANVSNQGVIAARMGSVALAGGQAVTLDVAGDGLLNVSVDQGAVNALVANGGLIQADGGQVLMTAQAAGNLLLTAVNNTGVVQAQTIDTRGGTIKLLGDMQSGTVNAGGTLDASAPRGGNGGFVETSAAHVRFDNNVNVTTAAAQGLSGSWLIDPTDFTIAASGGDMTGTTLTNNLKNGNVQILSTSGNTGTLGDINVNDNVSWSANKLTLTAQNNININTAMRGSGTASLALEYGQATTAGTGTGYKVNAEVDLPSGQNFSTRQGSTGAVTNYTVINSLGAAGSNTGTDLQGLGANLAGNYVLGSNIDARATSGWNNGAGWTPIGPDATPFTGKFDGLGHEINGLTIKRNSLGGYGTAGAFGEFGLFGRIGPTGEVRNLSLVNESLTTMVATFSEGGSGGLAGVNSGLIENVKVNGTFRGYDYGWMGGITGVNLGTIRNSSTSGTISTGVVNLSNDLAYGGGIAASNGFSSFGVGGTATGSISNSSSSMSIQAQGGAGGLVSNNEGSIANSFATGAVNGFAIAGGLVSKNHGAVSGSFATGAVNGTNNGIGGLVGDNEGTAATIDNSYATGNVTGIDGQLGGLVGNNSGSIKNSYATGNITGGTSNNQSVGGVVGTSGTGSTLENLYSSGTVSSTSATPRIGGVAGELLNAVAKNTYFNSTLNSGRSAFGASTGSTNGSGGTSGMATGLTTAAVTQASSYTGFNFTSTGGATGNNWVMVNADGTLAANGSTAAAGTMPMLASEYSTTINSAHQLQLMAMNLSGSYTLGSSFSAAGTLNTGHDVWGTGGFVSVGNLAAARRFTGKLDGQGHIVSGLNIYQAGQSYVGLFAYIGAGGIVSNIGLDGGSVTGRAGVGALAGANRGLITGSFANTTVVATSSQAGGLTGHNYGSIANSYATGSVTASNATNGVAGGLSATNYGSIDKSYSSGQVTGTGNYVGGLFGFNGPAGTTTNSFWNTQTSGLSTSKGGTGLTTAQLQSSSAFSSAGWDLTNTWIVYEGQTAPLLRSFMTPLVVKVGQDSKVYDGVAYAGGSSTVGYNRVVANGTVGGTAVLTGSATGATNAGSYSVSAGGLYALGGQTGYVISYLDGGLTITPKTLTVSGLSVTTKTYDGTTSATLSGGTLTGLVGTQTLGLSGLTGAFADANAGTGKAVNLTSGTLANGTNGGLAGNYTLNTVSSATGTITQKALTVTGATAADKTYDGNTSAAVSGGTLSGLVGSETLGLASLSGSFADKNAGSAKAVTVVGASLTNGTNGGLAANYTVTNPTGLTAGITPKALTVTGVTATTKTYDGSTTATLAGGTLAGLVGSETLNLSGQSGSFANANAGTGKAVTVTGATLADGGNGGLAGNYTVSNTTGVTGTVTAKALTIVGMTAGSKTYDGTTGATLSGGSLTGLVGSETLAFSGQSGAFNTKDAGTAKAVTVTGATLANGTGLASNYTVANPTGVTADITAKALTLSGVTAANKTYDGNATASLSGGSLSGFVGTETVNLAALSGSFSDKNAAVGKTVAVTGASLTNGSNGGLAGNYSVANPTGVTASITAKALTVSGAVAASKTYDGTTVTTVTGGTLNGLVGSETLTLSGQTGSFASQNVGTAKAVTVIGATLADGGNGGLAGNYTVANPTGLTANVTAKALTVTGVTASGKTYDGNTTAALSGGTLNGLVGSETLVLSGQSGAFSDKNAAAGKAVTVSGATLGNGTGLASNYTVSNATGVTADITAKALTVSGVTAAGKTYDGTTTATLSGGTLNGLVGSETLALSGQTGNFVDQNAAAGKAVTVTGATLANGSNGGLAGNYTVGNATGVTATIAQKALTVSGVTAAGKTYDGNTAATLSGGTLNGLVGSETLALNGQTGTFNNQNAGAAKAVTVSGTTLGNGTGLASNYTVSNATGVTADITAKALTISGVTAASKTYDGTTTAALSGGTLNGLVGSETLTLAGQSGSFSDKNAAAGKAVTVSGATLGNGTGLASNYTVTNATGVTADISAKALTVSGVTAANKTYDGSTTATLSGGTLNGLVGSETLALSGQTGNFVDQNAAAGKAVTVTGATLANGTNGGLAGNYTVGNATGVTASITTKALTVSGVTAASKSYDGTTTATLSGGTLNGLVGSETLALSGQSGTFNNQNAGTAKAVTVTGATLGNGTGLASNYTVSNATGVTADITAKALTVSGVTAASKTYDGTTTAALSGGTLNGLVGSETLTLGGQSGSFIDKNAAAGKAVTVSGATLGNGTGLASNYTVTNATGVTADITAKALTVSGVTAASKTYDGNTTATLSGGTLNGLVGSETLTLSGQTGVFSDKNAAAGKAVTVSGATLGSGTGLASNYTVSNATGVTADITAKALTVSGVTAANKTYDGSTTATLSGGTLNGLVGSETLALSGQTGNFVDQNAGTGKTVTVTGATLANGSNGGLAGNYTVSNATGVTAGITAKALTVSGVTAAGKTYDGTTTATLSGGTLNGLVGSETLALSGQTGTFNNQNVGTAKAVAVTGATLGNGTGLASNYTVSNATGVTADITAKALTVSGVTAASKTYDGTTTAALSGGTLNGLVGSETLVLSGQTGAFIDKNAAAGKAVTVSGATLGNGTGLASNYTVANAIGVTADINAKALTVSGVTAANKTYDGSTTATLSGGTLNGLVGSETLALSGQTGSFSDKNAAVGKTVTVTGATLANGSNGGLASNYTVSNATGVTADISAKALTVSGVTAANKTYDGSTTAALSGGTLNGLVGSETLALSGQTGSFSDQNAAAGKAVTVTGTTLGNGTGLASNYTVSNATGVTADIGAKALTVSGVTAASKTYDGTTTATLSGGTLNGLVGSETLALSGQTGTFIDQNAATGKTVTVTGATLGNGTGLASNYTVSNATGVTADITAKALTVSGVTAASKTYDGTATATLSGGTLNGLIGSETLALSGQTGNFVDQNAANGKAVNVTGTTLANGSNGGLASNYTVSNATGVTADIAAKALTVSGVTASNKVYDGTAVAALSGGTLNGLVGSETLALSRQTGSFSDKNAAAGKAVTVTGATLGNGTGLASNYTVSNATGVTADISAKALTVSGVTAASKTYDGTTTATLSGGTLNGLVGSETLALSGQTGSFNDQNAAAGKTVAITGATLGNGTGLASNYTVSNATGVTADVTAKALTVSGVTAAGKTYDGTTTASLSGGTLNGLVGSETLALSGQTGTFSDQNAAAGKTVTVTGATLGNGTGLASNYTVSNATGVTADITAKALTVTGVTAAGKTYDGTTTATLSGGALNGLVGSETLALSGQTGNFVDQNAANGKAVTVTGTTLANGSNGGLASNYTVSNATGVTADITAKSLTVSGVTAANKTYDGTSTATLSGGTLNGLVGSETLALSGQTGTFSDQNAAAGKAVAVTGATLGNGTGLASNYTVSNATGVTADITAKALTVTGVTAAGKTYDGTTTATLSGGTLNGLIGSETLALSGQTGNFVDQNAAAGKTVTVTGTTLGNGTGLASNYTVSNTTGVTADITPKALTVTGMSAQDKVADGTTVATLAGGSLAGLVGSETLGFNGQTGRFDSADAGVSKPVTVSGIQLQNGSGLAGNYSVSNPTGLSATITPIPVAAVAAVATPVDIAVAAAVTSAAPVSVGGNVVAPQLVLLPSAVEATQAGNGGGANAPAPAPANAANPTGTTGQTNSSGGTPPPALGPIGTLPPTLIGMNLNVVGSGINLAVAPPAPAPAPTSGGRDNDNRR